MSHSYMGTITEYGCIGEHLVHSFSGDIHARIGQALTESGRLARPYDYRLQELRPDELEGFLARRAFRGINVTIPYKQVIIPYLDELSEAARAIGAVNTVVCRDGRLIGDNTDFYGMKRLLRHAGIDPTGQKVLILGTGGTSNTAEAVAKDGGAREILKVSRTPGEGRVTYDDLSRHADVGVIINTTPAGMYPNDESCPLPPERLTELFPHLTGVLDAVYHPLRTELVLAARSGGVAATGGLGMLVAQATAAAERFLELEIDERVTLDITSAMMAQKQNIVLIGMPGSGKSTVGARLGEQTGKELWDTDAACEKKTGRTPGDYIREYGEAAFRGVEAEVIRDVIAPLDGVIVATGGGAVLRDDNVRRLKRNGVLVFLDRSLASLEATPDRPLSSDAALLRRRYEERHDRYEAVADVVLRIPDGETPERTTEIGRAHV